MKKRNYIGLATTFHDSAIAIINPEGKVVFAEASERYMQDKRGYNQIPDHIFRSGKLIKKYCDPDADFVLSQSWLKPDQEAEIKGLKEMRENNDMILKQIGQNDFYIRRAISNMEYLATFMTHNIHNAGHALKRQLGINKKFHNANIITKHYDHHLAHAATACFTSPFDEAACLIIDAGGEAEKSYGIFHYSNGKITEVDASPKKATGSLGIFFSWVCQTCGFDLMANEEWKVMGLAPYGKLDNKIYKIFKDFIKIEGFTIPPWSFDHIRNFLKKCSEIEPTDDMTPYDVADTAYTGQMVFEELYFDLINKVHALGLSENLVMGGGCSLNSTANGKITENTPFNKVHIYSAPADDGNALGAAWLSYFEDHPEKRITPELFTPYLGSTIKTESFKNFKRFAKIKNMKEHNGDVHIRAAELLAQNKIIGWVQGAAEFGPRALGNRSILASPAYPDIKNQINARVKFREEFRPFAPSILHEHGPEYFINYEESPYMERTLKFYDEVKDKIPGVVHANNSGRLQTVKREWNERYYDLINHFYKLTGIPILLNTSFNIMGKPIIHSIEDALAFFYTTGLDALVVEDIIIEK